MKTEMYIFGEILKL